MNKFTAILSALNCKNAAYFLIQINLQGIPLTSKIDKSILILQRNFDATPPLKNVARSKDILQQGVYTNFDE